jgi:hypothetical protein
VRRCNFATAAEAHNGAAWRPDGCHAVCIFGAAAFFKFIFNSPKTETVLIPTFR